MRIEIRNDSVVIEGYVNAVERDSRVLSSPQGRFVEQVRSKTFQRALEKGKNVELLMNHNPNMMLGSTMQGNLKLMEDNIGLRATAVVTDPDTMQKAKNNELVGWSFGFSARKDSWQPLDSGIQRRYLEDIDLLEVSILDSSKTPAYIGTSIESRDDENTLLERRTVDDSVEIIDNSTKVNTKEGPIDYSVLKSQIDLLKMEA